MYNNNKNNNFLMNLAKQAQNMINNKNTKVPVNQKMAKKQNNKMLEYMNQQAKNLINKKSLFDSGKVNRFQQMEKKEKETDTMQQLKQNFQNKDLKVQYAYNDHMSTGELKAKNINMSEVQLQDHYIKLPAELQI